MDLESVLFSLLSIAGVDQKMTTRKRNRTSQFPAALAFLAPNILGLLTFTLVPLLVSFGSAFTNWNVRIHNRFRSDPIKFVGLQNFVRLAREPDFLRFLGNTLFLMMGIPFAIGGSLLLALLLDRKLRMGSRRAHSLTSGLLLVAVAVVAMTAIRVGSGGVILALGICAAATLAAGFLWGSVFYRTLFYLPSFTSGVATILLWKHLFNPTLGPINQVLGPILKQLEHTAMARPLWTKLAGDGLAWAAAIALSWLGVRSIWSRWNTGETGTGTAIVGCALRLVPMATVAHAQLPNVMGAYLFDCTLLVFFAVLVSQLVRRRRHREWVPTSFVELGRSLFVSIALVLVAVSLVCIGCAVRNLPEVAGEGLKPPNWYLSYAWAKPSLMIVSFWAAVGSNNMLLYLAALSEVPPELYEAADLDGANAAARFWSVTWPQLAPTTFFIVVMSVIGGLQGGFELARTMTVGGPDGATTTLSYFIYNEGFITGRLGYSAAIAWALFAMVMLLTILNWALGRRYTDA
jgi:multiple sugar transport system permease protein